MGGTSIVHYSTEQWIDEVATHSGHGKLEPAVLEALLDEVEAALDDCGGGFTTAYRTGVLLARRRSG